MGYLIGAIFAIALIWVLLVLAFKITLWVSATIIVANDKILGAWVFLPPAVSWTIIGFLAGTLLYFAVREAPKLSRPTVQPLLIGLTCILVGAAPLLGALSQRGPSSVFSSPPPAGINPDCTYVQKEARIVSGPSVINMLYVANRCKEYFFEQHTHEAIVRFETNPCPAGTKPFFQAVAGTPQLWGKGAHPVRGWVNIPTEGVKKEVWDGKIDIKKTIFSLFKSVTKLSCVPKEDTVAPSTPSAVSIVSLNSSHVTISWNPSTDDIGVRGYRIYRDGTLIGSSVSTTYTDYSVKPSAVYKYVINAYDDVQVSLSSDEVIVTIPPSTPTPTTSSQGGSSTYEGKEGKREHC